MMLSLTLSLYIARVFLVMILAVFFGFLTVVYLGDISELLRRASYRPDLDLGTVALMALYKLAGTSEVLLSFSVLIACMSAYYGLSRRHELAVMRAAGISAWQFTAPACAAAFLFGMFTVTVYNPLAAAATSTYRTMEAQYLLGGEQGRISNVGGSVWLRQSNSTGAAVINAARGLHRGTELHNVVVYQFDRGDKFLEHIKADRAFYEAGRWRLEEAWITGRSGEPSYVPEHWVGTSLSRTQVSESLGSTSSISFWDLPQFIQIAERAGLSAHQYRVHYHMLLARPALFLAIALLAAVFCLRPPRFGQVVRILAAAPLIGLSLFTANHVSRSLGESGALPAAVAAWWFIALAIVIALTALFVQEDG